MVVSDTSPLINLAAIGRLELLRTLYGTVCIPEAVYREIVRFKGQPGAKEVQRLDWIMCRPCRRRDLATALSDKLDGGEAEAIALAVETGADLLIDERAGRRVALRLGCNRIGILGMLVEAKEQQHIEAVRPLLRALRVEAGFWISRELHDRVLEMVDEEAK